MGKWFGENIDWLVGTVVGVIGVAATLLIFSWQRKPKTLDYQILHNVAVLTPHASKLREHLYVGWDTEPLDNPRLIGIRIKNTGKEPIVASDFRQPLRFGLTEGMTMDMVELGGSGPKLAGVPTFDISEIPGIELTPDLLNSGEWFDIQIVADTASEGVSVSARFTGQTRPMRDLRVDEKRSSMIRGYGLILLAAIIVLGSTTPFWHVLGILPLMAAIVVALGFGQNVLRDLERSNKQS